MSYYAYKAEASSDKFTTLQYLILCLPYMDDFGNAIDPWEYRNHEEYITYASRRYFILEESNGSYYESI